MITPKFARRKCRTYMVLYKRYKTKSAKKKVLTAKSNGVRHKLPGRVQRKNLILPAWKCNYGYEMLYLFKECEALP